MSKTNSGKTQRQKSEAGLIACLTMLVFSCAALLGYGIKDKFFPDVIERMETVRPAAVGQGGTAITEGPFSDTMELELGDKTILPQLADYYTENPDMVGWLYIEDTVVDYPVMQTEWDEDYYLRKGFDEKYDIEGCLILDTDSQVGTGTAVRGYEDGTTPSTNLIIHGHNMKSGQKFGKLKKYKKADYAAEHNIIRFSTLFEEREYEVMVVFNSQVYGPNDNVFKYYQFFEAVSQQDFDYWYENIQKLALYDTGVTAEFGDEFITLSCCDYQTEDGRLVIVGKRIK